MKIPDVSSQSSLYQDSNSNNTIEDVTTSTAGIQVSFFLLDHTYSKDLDEQNL